MTPTRDLLTGPSILELKARIKELEAALFSAIKSLNAANTMLEEMAVTLAAHQRGKAGIN